MGSGTVGVGDGLGYRRGWGMSPACSSSLPLSPRISPYLPVSRTGSSGLSRPVHSTPTVPTHTPLQRHLLEQLVQAGARDGRHLGGQHVAAKLLEDNLVLQQLRLDLGLGLEG